MRLRIGDTFIFLFVQKIEGAERNNRYSIGLA